jgi:hypothetical protein
MNKIQLSRLQKKNHFSVEWVITCEYGTLVKDLLRPEFYCNIANKINKNDTIRAIFEDGSYLVDLLVIEVDKQNITPVWIKPIITNLIDIEKSKQFSLDAVKEPKEQKKQDDNIDFEDPNVIIKFRGPIIKWSVLRKSDKAVLREKIESKEQAIDTAKEISNQLL